MLKEIVEAIKKLSDEKIDQEIKGWGSGVITYEYNQEASFALGKLFDVLITADKKFMHIESPSKANFRGKLKTIELNFKLKRLGD